MWTNVTRVVSVRHIVGVCEGCRPSGLKGRNLEVTGPTMPPTVTGGPHTFTGPLRKRRQLLRSYQVARASGKGALSLHGEGLSQSLGCLEYSLHVWVFRWPGAAWVLGVWGQESWRQVNTNRGQVTAPSQVARARRTDGSRQNLDLESLPHVKIPLFAQLLN